MRTLIFIAGMNLGAATAEKTHGPEVAKHLAKQFATIFIGGHCHRQTPPDIAGPFLSVRLLRWRRLLWLADHIQHEVFVLITLLAAIIGIGPAGFFVYARYRLASLPSFTLLALLRIPYFVEYNDVTECQFRFAAARREWTSLGTKLRTSRLFIQLLLRSERAILSRAAGVRVVTSGVRRYVERMTGRKNVTVIPNGTNPDFFYPMDKKKCRQSLGLAEEAIYLCHTGSLTSWDGLDVAIDALALLPSRIRLLIVGEGDIETQIVAQAAESGVENRVLFTGPCHQEVVRQYIAASDICLLLKAIADYGLSPIKYYEYMACGRPLIATAVPMIDEVRSLGTGAVVSFPPRAREVADTIERMLSNERDLELMGTRAREVAKVRFSWENRVKAIAEMIRGTLEPKDFN